MLYYLILVLNVAGVIKKEGTVNTLCVFDCVISLAILAIVVVYAIKYAGVPTTNERYAKIITSSRKLLIHFAVMRLVFLNAK